MKYEKMTTEQIERSKEKGVGKLKYRRRRTEREVRE